MIKDWIIKKLRKPHAPVIIMVILLGLVMILLSNDSPLLSGIGISILASGVTSMISYIFLNPEDEYRTAKDWGLEKVWQTRGEMNSSCDEYLNKAKYIKAIGFGFKSLRDSQEAKIIRILKGGGNVQIITMKPDCEALKIRENDEGQDISTSIKDLITWANEMNEEAYKGKIEIKYHDHLPSCFVFLMNNRLFTGPYEYGKASQQTLSFEYRITGDAYEYYEKYFYRLWNNEKYCEKAVSE